MTPMLPENNELRICGAILITLCSSFALNEVQTMDSSLDTQAYALPIKKFE